MKRRQKILGRHFSRIAALSFRAGLAWAAGLAIAASIGSCAGSGMPAPKPLTPAVATADARATQAGIATLEAGGNAFDAAVAVTAMLAVVEPFNSGLGGGGFYLLHRASDDFQVVLDAREAAPLAATATMYLDAGGRIIQNKSLDGPLAAAIPGTPAALEHLARNYGKLPLNVTLAPAIKLARDGSEVSRGFHRAAKFREEALRKFGAGETFLVRGDAPPAGHVVRQPQLADTLELVARNGANAFYRGDLARRLVEGVRAGGGIWSIDDLVQYKVIERKPLIGQYRDLKIVSLPPPSSGGTVLIEALNVLEGFDLTAMQPIARKHVIIEAMRRAYRDRAEYLGDPAFVDAPLAMLTGKRYAERLRSEISEHRATASAALRPLVAIPRAAGENTTHFSIFDREGNRVAATVSLNTPFGSAYMPDSTGVLLNNTMDDFVSAPGQPNAYGLVGGTANVIQPGKRPLSSMTPAFIETHDRVGILGSKGGSRIISQVLLATLDFAAGNGPDSWVSAARYHHQYLPDAVQAERGALTDIEQRALEQKGHEIKILDDLYGNMHSIQWDKTTGRVSAASDPRGEGAAMAKR